MEDQMRDSHLATTPIQAVPAPLRPADALDEPILTPNLPFRPLTPGDGRQTMIQKVRGQASAIFLGGVQLYSEMTRSAFTLLQRDS